MAGTDCLYIVSEWARFVSLTTCSFLTPPTRKPYKRQSASLVLHLVSRVSAFATSAFNFVNRLIYNVRPRQRRKGTRQGRSQTPSQSAQGQHPGHHQGKSKECCKKFWDWPNFSIFSLPSAVSLVAAASSASPDSSTRKLVVCSRLAQKWQFSVNIQQIAGVPGERDS